MDREIIQHDDGLPKHRTKLSGLTIYFDEPTLESMTTQALDLIIDAYHRAYARFRSYVMGDDIRELPLNSFPSGGLVLTRSRETFRNLYHSPSRFNSLPDWVRDYVNITRGLYVCLLENVEDFLNGTGEDNGEQCHEFTHAILPDVLGLPGKYLCGTWPTWVHEAFAVGANQRKPREWLVHELGRPGIKPPSIKSIKEKGIFYHDPRRPDVNTCYQYCVWVAERVGGEIGQHLYDSVRYSPLFPICDLTQRAYRGGTDFTQAVQALGVDIEREENRVRLDLGLSPIQ